MAAHTDISFEHEVKRAAQALETDKQGLARHLGLPVGTLRSWEARGAPVYARLALAALVVKLNPDDVLDTQTSVKSLSRHPTGGQQLGQFSQKEEL